MKKLLFVAISLLFATSVQSQVTFAPDKPQADQTVTITYDPTNGPLAKSNAVRADAYYFDILTMPMIPPKTVALQKEGNLWKANVRVKTSGMKGFLMTFIDSVSKKIDNNNSKGYYFLVHDTNGKVLKGAKIGLMNAISAGTRIETMDLETDLAQNTTWYEEEFAENPSMKKIYFATYLLNLSRNKTKDSKQKINKELDELLAAPEAHTTQNLTLAATIYRQLDDSTKAEKFAKILREKEPKGLFVQSERMMEVTVEHNPKKKIEAFKKFEADIPNSMFLAIEATFVARAYAEIKDIEGLKAHIAKYENKMSMLTTRADMFNDIAQKLVEDNLELKLAEEYALKSLELLKKQTDQNKPASLRQYSDTYAYVLEKQGRIEEAFQYYKSAIAPNDADLSSDFCQRFVLAAIKTNHADDALNVGQRAIKTGKSTARIKEEVKKLLLKTQSPKDVEAHIASLEKEAKTAAKNKLITKMIKEPAPDFTLTDLKGNTVSLSSLKGKTVVLDFWATWCGPCKASFPGMKMAQDKYKNNPNVVFLFVDTWEKGDKETFVAKVKNFIAENKYDFNVPLDTENKVVKAYKVSGIPTKFVIDSSGNIRFKTVGNSGKYETIVEEMATMIDAVTEIK